ncbi:MAG: MBL fold metallo-hydrolase, partial [Chrysiogenetes bacterium]|nr:MBL fold metallo-hydrolase [Chrysiogenetes bacterium]
MKQLHRPDLFAWLAFDEARNLDFNGFAWVRKEGNVLIDPMPMSAHDLE